MDVGAGCDAGEIGQQIRPLSWRRPFDVPSFALAATVLMVAGVAASVLPVLRTTSVDPMIALRDQ